MSGLGMILGRGIYLGGGVARVWEVGVATNRIQWANWDPSPFNPNTTLGIFCGQVRKGTFLSWSLSNKYTWCLAWVGDAQECRIVL